MCIRDRLHGPVGGLCGLVADDRRLGVHGPRHDAHLPELYLPEVPDARFVVVEYDGVVPDGQLIEDAVFQQHLDVAPHRGVADFGLDVEALAVLSDFKWASDGEEAVVV